jgi:hypothetical protein
MFKISLIFYVWCSERQYQELKLCSVGGRAIAQEVSRWLPTAEALVRAAVWSNTYQRLTARANLLCPTLSFNSSP